MESKLAERLKDILAGANDSPTARHFRHYDYEVADIIRAFDEAGWLSPEEIRGEK